MRLKHCRWLPLLHLTSMMVCHQMLLWQLALIRFRLCCFSPAVTFVGCIAVQSRRCGILLPVWSGLSLCVSVCCSPQWTWMNRLRCHLGCVLGWSQGTVYLVTAPIPSGRDGWPDRDSIYRYTFAFTRKAVRKDELCNWPGIDKQNNVREQSCSDAQVE